MDDLKRLTIEAACKRVAVDYCMCVDQRRFDELIELFAKDGVMTRPDTGDITGRAAIRTFFDALTTDPLVHASGNQLVDVISETEATGASYVTVFRNPEIAENGTPKLNAPYAVARYEDRYVLEDGKWRFAYRATVFLARS